MKPVKFEQANKVFRPPQDLEESQCSSVDAYVGEVVSGSCDGVPVVVVAWRPDEYELERIKNGSPIFLSCIGGLPPHFLSTDFEQAIRPA